MQDWYASQCNGEWEHRYGISIGTIDNPGWSLNIELTGTELEHVMFEEYRENYEDETDWLICQTVGANFGGHCGPRKLERMIDIFLDWADQVTKSH